MPPCESRRQLEYERVKEEERKRKKRKELEKKRKQLEEDRRKKAITTVEQKARQFGWILGKVGAGKYRITKPYSTDLMEMEILHDGRIRVNTPGKISMPNHKSADAFLDGIAKALKGKMEYPDKAFPWGNRRGCAHAHALTMNLKKLQKTIETIGKTLPPKDDWMPALIIEDKEQASIFGFIGNCMDDQIGKDAVASQITKVIAEFKPDCACFITTAWSIDFEAEGMDEFDMELWKAGAFRVRDHPNKVEIVNAYVYGVRGPNEGEALMMGTIERFPDKGPRIKKWKVFEEDVSAEGRFPDAVKEGFRKAKGE